MLFAGETFLLGGGHDLSVHHERGGTVMVKCGDAKDVRHVRGVRRQLKPFARDGASPRMSFQEIFEAG
jgi:hypothetical protein